MATQPKIGVQVAASGTDGVKARMEEVRTAGTETFRKLGEAGKKVGEQVEGSLTKAAKAASVLGNATTGSVRVAHAATGALVRSVDLLLGKFSKIVSLAGLTGIGIAATFGGTYAGLRSVAVSTGEVIEGILKVSKSTGIGIDVLTRWQSAARIAGGTGDGVAAGFKSVTDKIVEAAKGSEDALRPFTQLDISIRDGAGGLKDFQKIALEVIDKLIKIENPTLRAKAAQDLFGAGVDDLVPLLSKGQTGLQRYLEQADKFGTVLNKQDAEKTAQTLERKRRLDESIKGLKFAISQALLPVFTVSTEKVADWMQRNSVAIRRFIADMGKALDVFQKDVENAFKGNDKAIKNPIIRTLAPALRLTTKLALDLGAAMAGRGFGTVLPWVAHAVQALRAFKGIADAVFTRTKGFIEDVIGGPLPTKDTVFQTLTKAFTDIKAGILGLAGPINFPSMRTLGEAVAKASEAAVNFGAILIGLAPTIIAFAKEALTYVSDAFQALRQTMQGDQIKGTNFFAFLNEIIPTLKAAWAEIGILFQQGMDRIGLSGLDWRKTFVDVFKYVADQIKDFYNGTGPVFEAFERIVENVGGKLSTLAGIGDKVARALGLKNWQELGIVLLLARLTGIDSYVEHLIPPLVALATLALAVVGFLGTAVGWIFTFLTVVAGVSSAVAGAVIAVPLILAGIYIFRDEIIGVFSRIGSFIVFIFNEFVREFSERGFLGVLAEGFRELPRFIKETFGSLGVWLVDSVTAVVDAINSAFWGIVTFFFNLADAIAAEAIRAWDGIVAAFSGLVEFFAAPIRKVGQMFADLWDSVKKGAFGAWDSVKSFFGFGGQKQDQGGQPGAQGGALPSFDVGGYVPGSAGAPLKAMVHGGERILNLQETSLFETIMGGLSRLGSFEIPDIDIGLGGLPAPAAAPALAGGGMSSAAFDLNGMRVSGFQGPPDAVRQMRMALARGATTGAGRMPRWYGGY